MTDNNRIASSFLLAMTTGWAFRDTPKKSERRGGEGKGKERGRGRRGEERRGEGRGD
jgi:hypothetical protein